MLEIHLLGQFHVQLDRKRVEIRSRPAQSLLAYLALTEGVAHRRERLAGLLWPDIPEIDARRNLRRALWHVRKATEGQVPLRADDISVAFEVGPDVWVDALALTQKTGSEQKREELLQIVSAYGGELLPGFYDEWIIIERERLQAVFESRIKLLLDHLQEDRDWHGVLEWAERWISLSRAPEPAYQVLMTAYSRLGDSSGVSHAYQRCVDALDRELGIGPSEETQTIHAQLTHKGPMHAPAARIHPSQDRTGEEQASARKELSIQEAPPTETSEPGDLADPLPEEAPFKGLQYFDEADASLFFGREALTTRLLERSGMDPQQRGEGGNLLVIVGASGSGKSSLVRAGLVPAMRSSVQAKGDTGSSRKPGWEIRILTPSTHPLEILAARLTRDVESVTAAATLIDDIRRDSRSLRLYFHKMPNPQVLVIDQFEELFTLCRDERDRRAYIDNLLFASEGGQCKLVLTLRADFYAHCAQYDNLRAALADHQEYIGPMSTAELRRAIEEPARIRGYAFEPGLVDLILRDVGSEPGGLPLLSHALLETWKRRQGKILTLAGYAEAGGVRGAIAHTAETIFTHLTPEQQQIARSIFIRLTEFGAGMGEDDLPLPDTRRRVTPEELILRAEDRPAVEGVLSLLAEARLLTVGEESVEVAHEALIREWPALRSWLTEDREGLRLHRRLTEAAQSWEELECEPGELYRGVRLGQVIEWAAVHPGDLNDLERDFLAASQALVEKEAVEREAALQREMEAARRFAESEQSRAVEHSRSAQRLRWLAAGLAVLLLAAAALASFAILQRDQGKSQAILATSRELAAAAVSNLSVDPERSILLALEAVKITDSREAVNALHQAIQMSRVRRTIHASELDIIGVRFSPDGKNLATGSADGSGHIWDLGSGENLVTLTGHSATINMVAYSPDGTRLATASDDAVAKVWNAQTGEEIFTLPGHIGFVTSVAFSPDGTLLATAGEDGTIRMWDAASGEELYVIQAHSQMIRDLAYSPDGTRMVTASDDQTAQVWEARTGQAILTLAGHAGGVLGVAYSPDGKLIATASGDNTAKLWDASTGDEIQAFTSHTNVVQGVAFSPTGDRLATGSYDGRVKIWSIPDGKELFSLSGRAALIFRVAFSPDGLQVASANSDGTVQLWDISPEKEHLTLTAHQGPIFSVLFSPDSTRLVTASIDSTAAIWDVREGQELVRLRGHNGPVIRAVFNQDGSRVATASDDLTARIWDASTGKELLLLSGHTKGTDSSPVSGVLDAAFSPEGTHLATAGSDSTIRIWDIASGKQVMQLKGHTKRVNSVAYSPDGTRLASGSDDNTIKIWDTTSGNEIMTLSGHTLRVWRVVFSQDGTLLASSSTDAQVILWDAQTGKQLSVLSGHTSTVFTVVFSPNMDRLASASVDGTTKVWDRQSGEELLTLTDQAGVSGVAFSPNGSLLATSNNDGNVYVDFLNLDDLIHLAKTRLTRSLSVDECRKFLHLESCPP